MQLWNKCVLSEPWVLQKLEENQSIHPGNLHAESESSQVPPHSRERIKKVPVHLGNKLFHHELRVLAKLEADCFLGLDVLERHKFDPLFLRVELELHSTHSVPLYHEQFAFDSIVVFRVVTAETVQVPVGHAKIFPAQISNWKRPPFHLYAVFEPLENIQANQDVSVQNIFFDLSKEVIPVVFNNMTGPDTTIWMKHHLGSVEICTWGLFEQR